MRPARAAGDRRPPSARGKHITCGDGGIVASDDERVGPLLQRAADKGMDRVKTGGGFPLLAPNNRMSKPQAAVFAAQLERIEEIAATRARLGNLLTFIRSVALAVRKVATHHAA